MGKDAAAKNRLKQFIEDYIPVEDLMKAGFFEKGTRKNQYDKIAERVCWFFGFKSIYEYKKVCQGSICDGDNCDGNNKHCKNYREDAQMFNWPKLKIDESEMISKDSWLN